jgi:hypothetical protein
VVENHLQKGKIMDKEQNQINCPIFNKQEPAINRITAEINKAQDVREKAGLAKKLIEEVAILLDCPKRDDAKPDCMNCHTICELRRRTASLVLKAGKLA